MQNYKSLRAPVMIRDSLDSSSVDTDTHTDRQTAFDQPYY